MENAQVGNKFELSIVAQQGVSKEVDYYVEERPVAHFIATLSFIVMRWSILAEVSFTVMTGEASEGFVLWLLLNQGLLCWPGLQRQEGISDTSYLLLG